MLFRSKIAKASVVAMMAGSDFIKTSTGMEPVNATLPVSLVMMRMIREFAERTGYPVGFKPAGGISSSKSALTYLMLVKEELGNAWLAPHRSSSRGEVDKAIERLFAYGGWADKYDGLVHTPPVRNIALAVPEPIGVVGVICPDEHPLLSFVSLLAPVIDMGNRCVIVPSQRLPLPALDLCQVLETSDVPAGVVNIVPESGGCSRKRWRGTTRWTVSGTSDRRTVAHAWRNGPPPR